MMSAEGEAPAGGIQAARGVERKFFRLKVGQREPIEVNDFDGWDIVRTGQREYWLVEWYVVAERLLAPDEGTGGENWYGPFRSSAEALRWWRSIPTYHGRRDVSRAPPLPRGGNPPAWAVRGEKPLLTSQVVAEVREKLKMIGAGSASPEAIVSRADDLAREQRVIGGQWVTVEERIIFKADDGTVEIACLAEEAELYVNGKRVEVSPEEAEGLRKVGLYLYEEY